MRLNMRFMAGNIVDGYLYFSSSQYNGLFKMEVETERISYIGSFEGAPLDRTILHRKCLVYGRWLIFIPQNTDRINLVNIDTYEQKTVKVLDEDKYYMFADAIIVDDLLYLMPGRKEQPAKIVHLDDYSVETIDCLSGKIQSEAPDSPDEGGLFAIGAAYHDGSIYMGLYKQSKIIQYGVTSNKVRLIETDIDNIRDLSGGKDGVWITDLSEGRIELLGEKIETVRFEHDYSYSHVLEMGTRTYVIPGTATCIGILNDDRTVTNMDYPEDFRDFEQCFYDKFYGYAVYEDEIYLFPYVHDNMLVISGDKLRTFKTVYETDPAGSDPKQLIETIQAYRSRIIRENGGLITESPEFTLDSYMEYIGLLD